MMVPPTYLAEQASVDLPQVRGVLGRHGYRCVRAKLPLKALAVRSGLGRYGRNNVCYVPGMGSFARLDAFYTNAPLVEDGWGEKVLMDACEHCSACEANCPTASIASDRFIIRAERCLTFMNELDGDFPDWVQPDWHNALIGCMRCQTVCPENACFGQPVLGESFTEEETGAILDATALDQLSPEIRSKLERLEWGSDNFLLMQRNLKVLLPSAEISAKD